MIFIFGKFSVVLMHFFLLVLPGKSWAESAAFNTAPTSNKFLNYTIENCQGQRCLKIKGEKAYGSFDMEFLYGKNVTLAVSQDQGSTYKNFFCTSMRYQFTNAVVLCDNHDSKGKKSFILGGNYHPDSLKDLN